MVGIRSVVVLVGALFSSTVFVGALPLGYPGQDNSPEVSVESSAGVAVHSNDNGGVSIKSDTHAGVAVKNGQETNVSVDASTAVIVQGNGGSDVSVESKAKAAASVKNGNSNVHAESQANALVTIHGDSEHSDEHTQPGVGTKPQDGQSNPQVQPGLVHSTVIYDNIPDITKRITTQTVNIVSTPELPSPTPVVITVTLDENSQSDPTTPPSAWTTVTVTAPAVQSPTPTTESPVQENPDQTAPIPQEDEKPKPNNPPVDRFIKDCLDMHNSLRSKHDAKPLVWNVELALFAASWIEACYFDHSHGSYGENLAMGYGSTSSAIQAWYDEVSLYDYNHPGFSHATGHFTQLVWKGSREIGCAEKKCPKGTYLACEYSPPGNVIGYFQPNVS